MSTNHVPRDIVARAADQNGSAVAVLTRTEAAELLRLRPRQLDRLGVPCLNLGHRTKRYVRADVVAWLDKQRQAESLRRPGKQIDTKYAA